MSELLKIPEPPIAGLIFNFYLLKWLFNKYFYQLSENNSLFD
jgi:hypothetical protein